MTSSYFLSYEITKQIKINDLDQVIVKDFNLKTIDKSEPSSGRKELPVHTDFGP